MGMLGEMFPGRKLRDDSGEDSDGQPVAERWDIDLDGGVVRLPAVPSSEGADETPKDP